MLWFLIVEIIQPLNLQAEKFKHDEKETKKLQDSVQSLQLRLAAREHICRNLQEKVIYIMKLDDTSVLCQLFRRFFLISDIFSLNRFETLKTNWERKEKQDLNRNLEL